VFDDTRQVGVTVSKEAAEKIAESAARFAALRKALFSIQSSLMRRMTSSDWR
jgi:hypothetical protein